MKDPMLPMSTRDVTSLLLIKMNTVDSLSSSEEVGNVVARVTDTVGEDASNLINQKNFGEVSLFTI